MVEQKDKLLQAAELTPELDPEEQFITNLYKKTLDWLTKDQQGKILAEFPSQYISSWSEHDGRDPGTTTWLSLDLEKGVIVETPDRIFALVMGRGSNSRYSRGERTLSFQFGMLPTDYALTKEDKNINFARMLTQQLRGYGSGEFFVDDVTGKVRIDCWADDSWFSGGKDIGKWPHGWTQEKLFTDEGINACLEIVQRTSRNAFIK